MKFRTYVRRTRPGSEDGTQDWYEVGPHTRRLSEGEVDAILGYTEVWTVIGPKGPSVVWVWVRENGWHLLPAPGEEVDAFTLSITFSDSSYAAAFHSPGGTTDVLGLIRPDGVPVDILRLRYVTGDVITEVAHPYWQDLIDAEKDVHGIKLPHGRLISGWTFGAGSVRHLEKIYKALDFTSQQRRESESLSYRADLAILRAFKVNPILPRLWKWARTETPHQVEMRWNNEGPWRIVDPKGLPIS